MIFMKTIKEISSLAVGDITANVIAAIFWFYLATIILPSEFGQIHYIIGIAAISSSFALIGTQNTLTVFIAKNKEISSTLFLTSLLCAFIAFLASYVIFNRIDIGLLTLGIILFTHGISSNLGKKNFKNYAIYSILQKSLMVIFSFLAYTFFGVEGILYGISLSYFVYIKVFVKGLTQFKIDFILLKTYKNFISTNYFLMLTNAVTTQADKLLIVPILGLTILGNYSLAIQVLSILSIVPSIILKYALPTSAQGIQNFRLRRNTILFSFFLTGVGVLILPQIFPLFFEQYTEVIVIIQIMSFSLIPITINGFYHVKFLANENGRIPLFSGIIGSIIMILGMIILGTYYGVVGIAITHVLTYSSVCSFNYFMDKKLNKS